MVQKVTDPAKMVTDQVLLGELARRGIDKDYVEFFQDYAPRSLGKEHSPYAKFYRDLKSNKRFMVVSSLPMVTSDGQKIEAGWTPPEALGGRYKSRHNLFLAEIQNTQVTITCLYDQPDGRKAGAKVIYQPELSVGGVKVEPASITPNLLSTDPENPNYSSNVMEWDYGICKRRLRIIEGKILGSWVFTSKPSGTVHIKYNQTGDYKLKLGRFKSGDDEEIITPADFDNLVKSWWKGYPITIQDSLTFYPEVAFSASSPSCQFDTTTFDFYGVLIRTGGDTILYIYSQSDSESSMTWMRIVKRTYTISTQTWSALSVVYDRAPTGIVGCPAGGIIGNNIFIFCTIADWSGGSLVNTKVGYIKSTDLTGTSWGSFVELYAYQEGDSSIEHLNHLVHVSGDTYLQIWHHISGTTYRVKVWKTTDAGVNWTQVTIYTGSTGWNEPALAYIGNNKLIALMPSDTGAYIGQATSADGGDTWSAVSNTNLPHSVTGGCPDLVYDSETNLVITVFEDRTDNKIKASWEDADKIYASPTSWLAPQVLDASNFRGYPSIVKVGTKNFFYVYAKDISDTDEDVWGGFLAPTASVDGYVMRQVASQTGESFSDLRSSAGTIANDSANDGPGVQIAAATPTNKWYTLVRGPVLFPVSLPANAIITAATASFYGDIKDDSLNAAPHINIYSSMPAGNTALVATDYNIASWGSTPFSDTPIAYANWHLGTPGTSNDFVLNAAGLAAIPLNGVAKFGLRDADYDVTGNPPTWASGNAAAYMFAWATEKGAGYKPKLVVTYTAFPTQYSGMRAQIGGVMQELCLVAAGSGASGMGGVPRIAKGGTIYDIYLVETTDPNASNIRIKTTTGIKAIRKIA